MTKRVAGKVSWRNWEFDVRCASNTGNLLGVFPMTTRGRQFAQVSGDVAGREGPVVKEAKMKVTALRAGAIVGGVLLGLTSLTQPLHAQLAPFPRFARFYSTWFARAMDQCTTNNVVIGAPGQPSGGCLQANGNTDNVMTMGFTKLFLSRRGRVTLVGVGYPFGARVKVGLVLRVTRSLPTKGLVTFADVPVVCPPSSFGFVATQRGILVGSTTLAACLGASLQGLVDQPSNIEVVDASLINVDNGKVFAKPGLIR